MDLQAQEVSRRASEKFDRVGPLGVTAEDYKAINWVPPEALGSHPGKVYSDLMTNKEILRHLKGENKIIKKYSAKKHKEDEAAQNVLRNRKRLFNLTIEYLRRIDRLPRQFRS